MKVGFTNGCFDLMHDGHRHLFRECASMCEFLIVAINNDASVKRLKGPERPTRPLSQRITDVDTYLHFMPGPVKYDHAVIPFDGDADMLVHAIQPDVVFRGHDQFGVGRHITVPVVRIARLDGFSTTWELQRRGK